MIGILIIFIILPLQVVLSFIVTIEDFASVVACTVLCNLAGILQGAFYILRLKTSFEESEYKLSNFQLISLVGCMICIFLVTITIVVIMYIFYKPIGYITWVFCIWIQSIVGFVVVYLFNQRLFDLILYQWQLKLSSQNLQKIETKHSLGNQSRDLVQFMARQTILVTVQSVVTFAFAVICFVISVGKTDGNFFLIEFFNIAARAVPLSWSLAVWLSLEFATSDYYCLCSICQRRCLKLYLYCVKRDVDELPFENDDNISDDAMSQYDLSIDTNYEYFRLNDDIGYRKLDFKKLQKQQKEQDAGLQQRRSLMPSIGISSTDTIRHEDRPDYTIANPLVVILGIGEYEKGSYENLIGVKMDYRNMIYLWNHYFKYCIMYQTTDGNIKYYDKNNYNCMNNINNQVNYKTDKFKQYWLCDEIEQFIEQVHMKINEKQEHDGLIFIVSCHGEQGGFIMDSTGDDDEGSFQLAQIFYKFNSASCPYLADKPKLFIVDACRGNMRSKVYYGCESKGIKPVIKGRVNSNKKTPNVNNNENEKTKINNNNKDNNTGMHLEANFRYIYGNPEGFAVFDGGEKGGYLIRSVKKVLTQPIALKTNLDEIVPLISIKVNQLTGRQSMQLVQDISNTQYRIKFEKRKVKQVSMLQLHS